MEISDQNLERVLFTTSVESNRTTIFIAILHSFHAKFHFRRRCDIRDRNLSLLALKMKVSIGSEIFQLATANTPLISILYTREKVDLPEIRS